jgi:probable rRNA maturation factor
VRGSEELKVTAGSSSPSVTGIEEFDRAARAVEALGAKAAGRRRVDVTLIGERRMSVLNRMYKGRRGAAEILTFAYDDDTGEAGSGDDAPSGEILICWKRLASAAERLGVARRSYLLRLVAHGLAHIEGFSHSDDAAADRMETREREMLRGSVRAADIRKMYG